MARSKQPKTGHLEKTTRDIGLHHPWCLGLLWRITAGQRKSRQYKHFANTAGRVGESVGHSGSAELRLGRT